MCNFLSAIAFKNGDILCDPNVDSHEDLVSMFDLKESKLRNWARIEYVPQNGNYHLIQDYELKIDENPAPEWVKDSIKEKWVNKLNVILKKLIVTENKTVLSSGTWILTDGVLINKLLYCRIIKANSATIKDAGSATIKDAGSATIEDAGLATIEDAGSATIKYAGSATIKYAGLATIINKQSAKIS